MLFRFLKKLIYPKNWFASLFFIANGIFSAYLFLFLFSTFFIEQTEQITKTYVFLIGLGIYVFCVLVSMSTLGEWYVRTFLMPKCVKAEKHSQGERLIALFNEVYESALQKTPSLGNKVKLYVSKDQTVNACALGKNSIILNEGILPIDDEELKGILAHEFAHLAHGDTLFSLALVSGNFIFSILMTVMKILCLILDFVLGIFTHREDHFISIVLLLFVDLVMWLWTVIGNFLINLTSRSEEYAADHYAGDISYAKQLRDALITIDGESRGFRLSVIAALNSSHPSTDKRIMRLERDFQLQESVVA